MNEIWRPVVGYEGLYEVSNTGRVRRVSDLMVLKFSDSRGYYGVHLRKDGKRKTFRVHRLVAQAFILNPDGLPEVNHIDENKSNNSVDNLEWCDHKYNSLYGTRLERIRKTRLKRGLNTGLTRQEYMKKYREDHPVGYHYYREYEKAYYEKNRERIKEKCRRWRENHPDYMKEKSKEWRENHPDYMKKRMDSMKSDD